MFTPEELKKYSTDNQVGERGKVVRLTGYGQIKSNQTIIGFTCNLAMCIVVHLQHDGWFQLQRIRSGNIQLRFKVISSDVNSDVSPQIVIL